MRSILLAALIALLPACAVAAEPPDQKPKAAPKPRPQRPAAANPCAIYGAGFIRIEGSTTCIKVGGTISFEAGSGQVSR